MARRSPDPVTEVRPVGTNRWARWGTLALLPALIWAILAGFLAYAASYYIPGAQSLRHGTLPALVATGGA